ncbi:hypothetical protein L7B14_004256 [Salmonella enterica]|nr:hypothetical protein [Salmonella enterica]
MQLTKDMELKVRRALLQYSEYQVANMYGLRVGTVRAIKVQMEEERQVPINFSASESQLDLYRELTATGRKQETPLEMGLRLHEDLFKSHNLALDKVHKAASDADYAGLEARVLSGFFTPSGRPTPAFWGYLSQYVKKSGHAMLDILHDKEIYAPEQLERALDIDSQLEDMTQEQAIALMRRVAAKVYANAFKDPSGSGADVQDSE